MEKNYILQADILDIIFEGKNKLYGAYELRKTYDRRLVKATFFTTLLVVVATLGAVFSSMAGKSEAVDIDFVDTEMAAIKPVDPAPALPEPPKAIPPIEVKQVQFTKPIIVKPELVTEADQLHEITETDAIGSKTVETGVDASIIAPPVEEKASTVIELPKVDAENTIFNKVEIEAQFPGGQAAWIRYLQKNLNPTTPVENGATAGTYRVIVKFIVSKDGSISDVTAETKHGFGMEAEAMKIIKLGPKWTPALQNGHNVTAYRRQPITFVIEEQ